MLIIGLTGSIATGKSTVSTILSGSPHNLPIIDADILARKAVEPGTAAYKAIVDYFEPSTPELVDSAGSLNRAALGRRVFGDTEERKRDRRVLNKIVHPAVRWEVYKLLLRYYLLGHWAVVLDVPLLYESGMDVVCGTVVMVAIRDVAVQSKRLRLRDPSLSEKDASNRIRSQAGVMEKVEKTLFRNMSVSGVGAKGIVLWNDSDRADLANAVDSAMARISASSPKWWSWLLLIVPPIGIVVGVWNMAVNFSLQRSWDQKVRKKRARQ